MISSFIVDRIKYTVEIMDYMDKNLTLKYKHLIKGIEQHLLFLQRNVERYMKTSTGWTPMFYFERRKLTEVITEIINSPERINSICRKYRYSNKKELNRKCKNYFGTDLEDIIRNKDIYKLQDKVSEEEMLKIHTMNSSLVESIKLTKLG